MRIIAGQWRGRKIEAPPGDITRPTTDRVREALFSMLASRLGTFEGLRIADLFAGSGALGLEALSRRAAHCTFVERDRTAIKSLEKNIAALDAAADIWRGSAGNLGPASQPYDLIAMDPPYGSGLADKIIANLSRQGWIGPSSWISVETERNATVAGDGLTVEAVRQFGKAQITLLRKNPTP
ncbi:16S rRNA (guanine(966)-N(2))-methyltransferase RsmD [Parasphingopyxis lamellibrachiae]|uniref:16S rRNA (Guanine966-N2)-methyltransferase n=1 Tax=Parasphingopyxis lamellibrachiae TaxID=680125 RepID=A0A3D9FF53_9SPHN|nr:16S rRNA (guanine(966)-N(2))-methyltransferase RsmD [Parasphingopyxis lamellibrachiae]RED15711.1 16S rRNA (guanine966-N2)-methyltransferase [Parasphingopyxis lamellibrachiae]